VVIKRDGHREPFDRDKLLGALMRSTHKRDLDPRGLEALVARIEKTALSEGGELSAQRIVELCLAGLEKLDRGAYLQFAGTLPDAAGALP
jgi:transcriptional repressor NrdR